jgi:cytochrome c-type biogenesis protein CcmH
MIEHKERPHDNLSTLWNSARPELKQTRKGAGMSETTGSSSLSKLALYGALLILIATIGYSVWRGRNSEGVPTTAPTKPGSVAGSGAAISSLEERTRKNPKDVEGWQLLGWSYFETGRYADAAHAYDKATQLAPEHAVYWSSLGEALVMADEHDPMPKAAAAAFDKAITLDAQDPRARYFVAVRKDLAGDHKGAVDDWLALLKDTPKDAPWESDLIRTIQQIGQINKIDVIGRLKLANEGRLAHIELPPGIAANASNSVAASAIPGPSRNDMAQAAKLPPGQQQEMVIAMVEGLETKLVKDPNNINGWIMLIRSRVTLGETAKAAAAFQKAVAANPSQKDRLVAEAQILRVPVR